MIWGTAATLLTRHATVDEARTELRDASLAFYNHRLLHSTLGYLSPMQYEQRWRAAQPIAA